MDKILDIAENVFNILEAKRRMYISKGSIFTYSLRRSNIWNKLEKGYWFYGNKYYIAISFWSGMDWKSRSPNIFFSISRDYKTSLVFTSRDSLKKTELISKLFANKLNLRQEGIDRWSLSYDYLDYKTSLEHFIYNDKKIIDNIISENKDLLISEDELNSIGFIHERDFNKWFSNILKYREKKYNEKYLITETNYEKLPYYKLPYSVASVKIENFGPIIKTSIWRLPKNSQIIFLVGDNGGGKTTILRSLALALGNGPFNENELIDYGDWTINLKVNEKGNLNNYYFRKYKYNDAISIPFAAYGPSRLITKIEGVNEYLYSKKKSQLYSIFNPDAILIDFNKSIFNSISNPTKRRMSIDEIKLRWENIKQIIIDIIPNLYDIRIVEKSDELMYIEQDKYGRPFSQGVKFSQTSSGVKSLIAMLGDMLIRLFDFHPYINDPAELTGIVLIDEIDIHLHPDWQMKIPTLLTKNFPKIQFIVTTHSPIPLLGAPKNSAFIKINRDINDGIIVERLKDIEKNIGNLLPNVIYTSHVFGMKNIISITNKDKKYVLTQDNNDEAIEYSRLKEKFKVPKINDLEFINKIKNKLRN